MTREPERAKDTRRPRLSERALARLHFVEGRCRVLLHDVETGDVIEIGPREWVLFAAADGTRDIDGLLLSASREGVAVTREALCSLLDGLESAGMLEDGPLRKAPRIQASPQQDSSEREAPFVEPSARLIERLAGYSFSCDGHGSCCKLYATVVFSPLEAARARSLLPLVLDGGDRHEHVFMPERGAGPCAGSAVALVDGRCAYLDGHLCALHRAGGGGAKPLGCTLFPLALVDDGRRVRASVAVECACVLESIGNPGGDTILPENVRSRGDLDPALVVDELPKEVEIVPGKVVPRDDYLAWGDAALGALNTISDAAIAAWSLAEAIDRFGLDPERMREALSTSSQPSSEGVSRMVAALGAKAARRAKAQSAWRSERDLCRQGVSIIAAAAALLADMDVLGAVTAGAGQAHKDEHFYLRTALFGHQIVGYPLSVGLRDRAVAMWIARVFPLAAEALYPDVDEPSFLHPIALVEALLRGHGLRLYVEEAAIAAPAS